MGITTAEPTRLLDLTRLARRAGRPLTGIDRVERAYLAHLLQEDSPLYALVRTPLGYLLVGREGCADFLDRLDNSRWEAPDRFSRMRFGSEPVRARAEAALRRAAVARCVPQRLTHMLVRHLPPGTHYLNTGHSNLTERVIAAIRAVRAARIAVLLHDTIPLDFPGLQSEGMPERFHGFLTRVCEDADLVICNSHRTESDLRRHMPSVPQTVVARLGVDPPVPGTAPEGPWAGAPYFVALGTIEPRKNHALLLDIWEHDPPDAQLLLCGARGWRNEGLFDRLDRGIPGVHELPGLADPAVFALLRDSAGLLFPSLAEGYGLPPLEAAALGVPILCNDLPALREGLGDIPVYADAADRDLWAGTIGRMARNHRETPERPAPGAPAFLPPDWDSHFKIVLTLV